LVSLFDAVRSASMPLSERVRVMWYRTCARRPERGGAD